MRHTLAPLSAAAFFLRKSTWRLPGIFPHQGVTVNFSDEEFTAILEAAADFSDYRSGQYFAKRDSEPASGAGSALRLRDTSMLPPWAVGLRRMLSALADFEFNSKQGLSLVTLCEAGARYGWHELETAIAPKLLALVSPRAKRRLKRGLQRILQRATRPCLELERTSYNLALAAIGLQEKTTDPKFVERKFLGEKPSERLFSMFRKFPVLSRLWLQLISQWCDQVTELFVRLAADRAALSHAFLGGQPVGPIVDLRCGLSDPHNKGRTVMLLQFAAGSVIYKPRPGDGEWEWGSLLEWMNAQSFQPRLRVGRVLRRKGYCWMERLEVAPCKNGAAARRFHERIGGLIAAAYLLKAVDCHRDNVIAAGEHPVLVDTEALWHPSGASKPLTPVDLLLRSGFLSAPDGQSLQARSSVLAYAAAGQHVPRLGPKPLRATKYDRDIINGFNRAWRCVLGTNSRRAHFVRRLRRIRSLKRRVIFLATEKYAAIIRASIQPGALRSGIERELMLSRLCSRRTATSAVIHAEIDALKRLDIPYFVRRIKERSPPDKSIVPTEVIEALRRALD